MYSYTRETQSLRPREMGPPPSVLSSLLPFFAPPAFFRFLQNIGVNDEAGYLIRAATGVENIGKCCKLCAQTGGCQTYLWYESGDYTKCRKGAYNSNFAYATVKPNGWVDGVQCYLLKGGSAKEVGAPGFDDVSAPFT